WRLKDGGNGSYRFKDNIELGGRFVFGEAPIRANYKHVWQYDIFERQVISLEYNNQYGLNSPIWSLFDLTPPPEALPPKPIEPKDPGRRSCDDHNRCTTFYLPGEREAYEKALAQYQEEFKAYTAIEAYYIALADKIDNYNRQYGFVAGDRNNPSGFYRPGSVIMSYTSIDWYTQYEIDRQVYEDQVKTSDPALISAGGNLILSDNVLNDKSQIVAGGIILNKDMVQLNNIDAEGKRILEDLGTSEYSDTNYHGGFSDYHERRRHGKVAYQDTQEQTIDLRVAQVIEHQGSTAARDITAAASAKGTAGQQREHAPNLNNQTTDTPANNTNISTGAAQTQQNQIIAGKTDTQGKSTSSRGAEKDTASAAHGTKVINTAAADTADKEYSQANGNTNLSLSQNGQEKPQGHSQANGGTLPLPNEAEDQTKQAQNGS
ncbi:hypothetical protein, partial [Stenoxybacter acetivorans]|uniref:hypothetical protein n=1 Tax=Stenoxybacter acetivorans TaxID=422441 RepID=UPI000561FF20